jgi:hypothetical protein
VHRRSSLPSFGRVAKPALYHLMFDQFPSLSLTKTDLDFSQEIKPFDDIIDARIFRKIIESSEY